MITSFDPVLNFVPDQNGNTTDTTELPSSVEDIDGCDPLDFDQEECDLCNAWEDPDSPNYGSPACDAQDTFEYVFDVTSGNCRNANWLPWEYLIRRLYLTGNVVECGDYDNDPNTPDTCDLENPLSELRLYCETQTPCREDWSEIPYPGVEYICVDEGQPIAWDDSYSVRSGKTLRDNVLGNDSDAEDATLVVSAAYVETFTTSEDGTVVMNANGRFTYTPDNGFTGEDSFNYTANNGANDSNVATVTITVY
jgi:hypothetical protein